MVQLKEYKGVGIDVTLDGRFKIYVDGESRIFDLLPQAEASIDRWRKSKDAKPKRVKLLSAGDKVVDIIEATSINDEGRVWLVNTRTKDRNLEYSKFYEPILYSDELFEKLKKIQVEMQRLKNEEQELVKKSKINMEQLKKMMYDEVQNG